MNAQLAQSIGTVNKIHSRPLADAVEQATNSIIVCPIQSHPFLAQINIHII